MPPARRKSVAFAFPDEADADAEGARQTRNARTRTTRQQPDANPSALAESNGAEPAARATRSRKEKPNSLESDGGFKFKRRKTGAETSAAAPPPPPPAYAPMETVVEQSAAPSPAPPPPPPPMTPAEPSLLEGAPPELLHALYEVCTAAAAASSSAAASAMPTADLAAAACLGELRKLGVTRAPPANVAAATLAQRELELRERVSEVQERIREWDEAAEAPLPPCATMPVGYEAPADTRLLANLPDLPPIEAQLAELGALAGLCAEQVSAASRQVLAEVARAEDERQRLAKAAHLASFKGYLDVHQPKTLLRSLVAF